MPRCAKTEMAARLSPFGRPVRTRVFHSLFGKCNKNHFVVTPACRWCKTGSLHNAGPCIYGSPPSSARGPRTWLAFVFPTFCFVNCERTGWRYNFLIGGICMRISGLLAILLCGLVSVCAASDATRQGSSSQTAVNSFNSDFVSPSAIARQDFIQVWPSDRADQHYAAPESARDGDVTCFTMHTFLVKRESPHSDVTEPAGESTCLSGPRYSVRKVEESGKAPSR